MESSRAQSGDLKATLAQEIAYVPAFLTFTFANLPSVLTRYAKSKLALAPNNPSAWNYLRGSVLFSLTLPPLPTRD